MPIRSGDNSNKTTTKFTDRSSARRRSSLLRQQIVPRHLGQPSALCVGSPAKTMRLQICWDPLGHAEMSHAPWSPVNHSAPPKSPRDLECSKKNSNLLQTGFTWSILGLGSLFFRVGYERTTQNWGNRGGVTSKKALWTSRSESWRS